MSETDARLSFERHATSKIRDVNDLFNIRTMGFRGEALASIAAIAQVSLISKRPADETGTHIQIEGSRFISQEPVACNTGSIFSIKNLFYNVPARRKFLKTNSTELKHIITEFQRIALANANISFSLHHNNTEIYNLQPSSFKQRIIALFGKSAAQYLVNISLDTGMVKITGFIGKPEYARKSAGEQFFFVNNRFVRHSLLHKAVLNAYNNLIPAGSYPSYFIYFDVDPKTIDINIHPTKTEIKFQDEQAIFQFLQVAVRESLGKSNFMPAIDFNTENKIEIPLLRNNTIIKPPVIDINPAFNPFDKDKSRTYSQNRPELDGWQQLYPSKESTAEQITVPLPATGGNRLFQFKHKYILMPVKSGLMIIDQHRAHQRILFERYKQLLKNNTSIVQQNLFPHHLDLEPSDHALILELKEDLSKLGFDIADFGNHSVIINGIPAEIKNPDAESMIYTILDEYRQTEEDIGIPASEKSARSMAAASAIPYGTALSTEEMQEIVDALFSCEAPGYSPAGKPVLSILSNDEIEKRF